MGSEIERGKLHSPIIRPVRIDLYIHRIQNDPRQRFNFRRIAGLTQVPIAVKTELKECAVFASSIESLT